MKVLNVKRLAAIGLGAALIGTALAPVASALTLDDKSTLVDSTTGKPLVDVVVGANAAVSDVVWAGNIATRVAQLATIDADVTPEVTIAEGTGEETVVDPALTAFSLDLVLGGTTTYATGSAKTYDDNYLTSTNTQPEYSKEITNSTLTYLKNATQTQKWNSTTYSETVKEILNVKPDFKFDYTNYSTVGDLVGYMTAVGDFNYSVTFSHGLPLNETTAQLYNTSGTQFQYDKAEDSIIVPFFGDTYKLYRADATGTYVDIKLIKDSGEATYYKGDIITGLKGAGTFAGKDVTVEVTNVFQTSATSAYSADFSLKDTNGKVLSTATSLAAGVFLEAYLMDSSGNAGLSTSVYLSTVGANVETGKTFVTVTQGTDVLELVDTKAYPYVSTDTDTTDDYWIFDTGAISQGASPDVNVIKQFSIYNNVKKWNNSTGNTPMWVADDQCLTTACVSGSSEAVFLQGVAETTKGYNFAKITFDGFKKTGVDFSTLKLGANYVDYYDNSDFHHKVPFYVALDTTLTTQGSFTIDNQTFYYRVNDADANFSLGGDNNVLNGVTVTFVDNNIVLPRTDSFTTVDSNYNLNLVGRVTVDFNGITYPSCALGSSNTRLQCVADGNFQISQIQFASAANSDFIGSANLNKTWYYEKADAVGDMNNITAKTIDLWATVPLTGSQMNNKTFKYAYYRANTGYNNVYLMLSRQTDFSPSQVQKYAYGLQLSGTDSDLGVGTVEDGTVDQPFYVQDLGESWARTGGASDYNYYIAIFNVNTFDGSASSTTVGTTDANVYIATDTSGKLPVLPNNNMSTYTVDAAYLNSTWTLSNSTAANYMKKGYSEDGAKLDITDNVFTMISPASRLYLKMSVVGSAATTTVTGTACTPAITADGGKCTTSTGTEITLTKLTPTVEQVTYTAGCSADQLEVANVTANQIVAAGNLVVTDEDVVAGGNHVLVGGYLVNTLAKAATIDGASLEEVLTADNPVVVEATDDGDYVVAGYSADDTVDAAQQFIAELDKLLE